MFDASLEVILIGTKRFQLKSSFILLLWERFQWFISHCLQEVGNSLLPSMFRLLPSMLRLLPALRLNDDFLDDNLLLGEWFSSDIGLESMNVIGSVVNSSQKAVSVVQLVRSLNCTVFSAFVL